MIEIPRELSVSSVPIATSIRAGLLAIALMLSLLAYLLKLNSIWIFTAGVLAIAILAEWIRISTEQLALHAGPLVGGLLTVSFGSVAELVLAAFVLARGNVAVVHAQITGSIIGTCLFGLGIAVVIGGVARERQRFRRERASLLSSMLIVVVIALLLPAIFDYVRRSGNHAASVSLSDENLSLVASVVLLALYCGNLVYTLITHHDAFSARDAPKRDQPKWSLAASVVLLALATAGTALESELVSGALTDAAHAISFTPLFMGVVVLALVGTSPDLFAAATFAHKDQIGLTMSICIGSAIQIALVVAPLLVIMSVWIGTPMTLVFTNPLDLFSIAGTAFIVNSIAGDGETTWFEGMLLLGVYFILGTAYFLD